MSFKRAARKTSRGGVENTPPMRIRVKSLGRQGSPSQKPALYLGLDLFEAKNDFDAFSVAFLMYY